MTSTLADVALVLGSAPLLAIAVKATLIAAAALAVSGCLVRVRASVRHLVLTAGFALLLVVPIATLAPIRATEIALLAPRAPAVSSPAGISLAPAVQFDRTDTSGPTIAPSHTDSARPGAVAFLLALWVAGTIASLAPVFAGLLQLRRYRRLAIPAPHEEAAVRALACRVGVVRRIDLLFHESVPGPMTYGVLRPLILLPATSRRWETNARHSALLHEIEHIRRRDWVVHCASRVVCSVYWFHPLVWTMWRRLALDAERACDDAVLREAEPAHYADQLVDLAEMMSVETKPPLLAMASRDDLAVRVRAVLDTHLPRGQAGRMATALVIGGTLVAAAMVPLRAVAVAAPQTAAPAPPRPSFSVASVKINTSGGRGVGAPPIVNGRFTRTNIPVDLLIAQAYAPLQRFEIAGVPEWATTTRVDIEARFEAPLGGPAAASGATPAQVGQMLQSLLAERFNLAAHREVRQQPVYALVQSRPGQPGRALKPHDAAACVDPLVAAQTTAAVDPNQPLPPAACGAFRGAPALGRLRGQGVSLEVFGRSLSGQLGRMVVDRTGLGGAWDLLLEWTPLQAVGGVDPNAGAGATIGTADRPSIFTAVQEQLGLKLEPQTGPVNVLVIDRVELPTEN